MKNWAMFLGLLLSSSLASADVPTQLHYNGYLTNAVGEAVDCPDALQCGQAYDLTFRLYQQADGGALLWEETHPEIGLYQGSFHAILGALNPITSELLEQPTWLAVKVNDSPEMLPRQALSSAAYALRAQVAESAVLAADTHQLGGLAASEYATGPHTVDTHLTEEDVDAMVANNDYAVGPHTVDTLSSLTCAPDQVARWNGSSWACSDSASTGVSLDPIPCDAEHAGEFHLDTTTNKLTLCNGDVWLNVRVCDDNCPSLDTAVCGEALTTDCGTLCPGSGTSLNATQCLIAQSTALCGTQVLDQCENACGMDGTDLDLSQCLPNVVQCGQAVQDPCGNICGMNGTSCGPGDSCLNDSCCGNNVVEGSESCDDGNLDPGDGCDESCQNEGINFVGYAFWSQTCSSQSDANQDSLMDTACQNAHGLGSRAASNTELIEGTIDSLPGSNGSGEHLILKCPECAGTPQSFCVSGHSRKCVNPGASWPTGYGSAGWNPNCNTSSRSALCVQ
jgi:cysteine-rich repeat protein